MLDVLASAGLNGVLAAWYQYVAGVLLIAVIVGYFVMKNRQG